MALAGGASVTMTSALPSKTKLFNYYPGLHACCEVEQSSSSQKGYLAWENGDLGTALGTATYL